MRQAQVEWEAVTETVRALRRSGTPADGSTAASLLSALIASGAPALISAIAPQDISLQAIVGDVRDATAMLAAARYQDALQSLLRACRASGVPVGESQVVGSLLFAADLADARTAEDVSATFRRYSPGARGSAFKRDRRTWFASLNGYVGAAVGREVVSREVAGYAALTLPVGAEIGRRIGPLGQQGRLIRSIGLLAQVIDLGAIASTRLGGTDPLTKAPPSTFSAVLSPGLLLRFGLFNSPFVFGLGAAYAAEARRDATSELLRPGTRAMFMFGTDVPLFNLLR